ncbi:hypothetical protein NUW54_g13839 [Trametes sanguinea]|uniref:Uncharacterized protein n=1 Tax=Trametes sanguinea TaxID=158606 RepID=A0ACC1MI73_9APHY|nr:hypothetical protein NUW54_g13839 [Trametes sanguinea]
MFTLPSAPSHETAAVQVVQVTENAAVLEALFRLCYPMEHQCIEDLSLLRMVLDAAHKYDMAFISERLKANLRALVPSAAIRVYCVAYLTNVQTSPRCR